MESRKLKVRSNTKHMKDIIKNATNIYFNGMQKKQIPQEELIKYTYYLGSSDTMYYYGNGEYIIHTYTYSVSFKSLVINEFENKLE